MKDQAKIESGPLTASGLVYLFGEEFAQPAKSFGGETLPYGGQNVDRESLANRLFEVAFISLAADGYLSLRLERPRRTSDFFVPFTKKKEGNELPASLERAIMYALRGDSKKNWVFSVILRVLRCEMTDLGEVLRINDPVNYVKEWLVEAGYLEKKVESRRFWWDKHYYSAREEAIAPLAGEMEILKASLEIFASTNPDLLQTLIGSVSHAIKASPEEDY